MSLIKNKKELATSKLRRDALDILEAGLEAIDTEKILRQKITMNEGAFCLEGLGYQCQFYEKIYFVGIGKCALDGARVIEEILGEYLTAGIVIDVEVASADLSAGGAGALARRGKIKSYQGTHPYPSEQNITATKEIIKMVEGVTEKDLVVVLISGGGSALFDLPDEAVTAKLGLPGETSLETIIRITKELTAKGADIYELNKARKEMSRVKGGKFAQRCLPASVVSLIISDVPGDDIHIIASGPTVLEVPNDRVKNILLISNQDALKTMRSQAENLGYQAKIETGTLSGNATAIGRKISSKRLEPKTCLLFGGETTVKVTGDGVGGRNQEVALAALRDIQEGAVLIACASDGWDNSEHAGALVDKELLEKVSNDKINVNDYLEKNNSYNFFKKVGGGIETGRLGSNVSDLFVLLHG